MSLEQSPRRKLLRYSEVIKITGRSRTSIWRDVHNGRFPAPVQTGPNTVAWFDDEVFDWIAARPRVVYASGEAAS